MTRITTQDTMATDPARTASAVGWPRAARWPDGIFTSAPPGTDAPSRAAQ